jgi:hypothetical protein
MAELNEKVQFEYHVCLAGSANGESLGPWSLDQIVEKLAASQIAVTDFVYDEVRQDWIPLLECEALRERLRQQKPKAPPPLKERTVEEPVVPGPSNEGGKWFVQKGSHRYGPFTYLGLVRALQEKTVYEFDFACMEGMENWVRIAELEDFQPERIRHLTKSTPASEKNTFLNRAHPRIKFESEVIVHDDRSAWVGRSIEGSVGGSGLVIENAALYPGQVVRLHFAATEELPAFNALAEIVNKQFIKELRGLKTPVRYSVRFLELDRTSAGRVKEYFGKQAV